MPEENRPKTDDNDPLLQSVAEEGQKTGEPPAEEDEDLEDLQ